MLQRQEYLFEKPLSKLNAGTYTQIMQGISVVFEAVSTNLLPSRRASHEGAREDSAITLTISLRAKDQFIENKKVMPENVPADSFTARIS